MKKVVSFNVGDKVFAKVKGYPAWPAMIMEDQTTKFNVRFYGTGETGIVKSKDLFYYLKHKKTFIKPLKRKDYNEAIEEIESAIKECGGTDGNLEEPGELPTPSKNANENTKNKRKRSESVDKANGNPAKKLASEGNNDVVPETTQPEKPTKKVLPERSPRKLRGSSAKGVKEHEQESTETILKETDKIEESKKDEEIKEPAKEEEKMEVEKPAIAQQETIQSSVSASDIKIISEDYLNTVISYAEAVKKEEDKYKKKSVEVRKKFENEVVLTKIPSGKYVGIKYNREPLSTQSNEFDQAVHDATEAKTVLSLKQLLEEGKCNPESDENVITNVNINEEDIHESLKAELIEHKQAKLSQLKLEANVVELDAKIKKCLGLDKAQPKEAVEYLEEMLKLNIQPLMLKKHPHVLEMIKRLARYIGNVGEWDFTKEQLEEFEVQAENVRKKAEEVFSKFAQLFDVATDSLWKLFSEEVEIFKANVKNMSESDVFQLLSEPESRQAFFDKIGDVEETKIVVANEEKQSDESNNMHTATTETSSLSI